MDAHVPALKVLPEFELHAVCTTRQETADEAARAFQVPLAFGSWQAMVEHSEIDLIVVCVRVPHHREIVLGAVNAGKDVFCEWPLGRTTAEAEEMLKAAEARNVRHLVGLQGRVAPAILRIRDLVADRLIGDVISVTMVSSLAMWGPETSAQEAFRLDRNNGATGLTITGGHSLDALTFCFGELQSVTSVVGTQHKRVKLVGTETMLDATSPDQAVVCGTFLSGALLSLHVKVDIANPTGVLLEVNGTEGDLIASTQRPVGPRAVGIQRADLRVFHGDKRRACHFTEIEVPRSCRPLPAAVPSGSPLATANLYARYADAVYRSIPIEPNFRSAVACHRVLDAVQRASDSGQVQSIKTTESRHAHA